MTSQPPEATSQSDAPPSDSAPAATDQAPTSPEVTDGDAPSLGWNDYAERLNGRFAMLGFAALLITELFTRQDFWSWIGL